MKLLNIVQGEFYSPETTIKVGSQVALSAFMPSRKYEVFNGEYNVWLVTANTFLLLSTITYDKTDANYEWVKIQNLEWRDVVQDLSRLDITFERKSARSDDKPDISDFSGTSPQWKFKILVKDKGEVYKNDYREDPNQVIDSKFCTGYVRVNGDQKILGAECPINPDTKSQMDLCLNWRRTDDVGQQCKLVIEKNDKENSIERFCSDFYDAEDCKCVNRIRDPVYLEQKQQRGENDYCWYTPCSSGFYLVKDKDRLVECNGKYCQVFYQASNVGETVLIRDNKTVQNCDTLSYDIGDKKKILITICCNRPLRIRLRKPRKRLTGI